MPITPKQQQDLKRLGARVKALREEKGLTLKQLAHTIGKDAQSIHRLEMGGINPSYLYLKELCTGLEISLNQLD